jgi:hypothetical protein
MCTKQMKKPQLERRYASLMKLENALSGGTFLIAVFKFVRVES